MYNNTRHSSPGLSTIVFRVSRLAAIAIALAPFAGCSDEITSCTIRNENDESAYCAESSSDGPCSATAPMIAEKGEGCAADEQASCDLPVGKLFYYKYEAAALEQLETSCGEANGNWSD